MTYISIIAVAMIFLNTYPLTLSRDLIFLSKKSNLLGQATIIGNALEGLDTVSYNGVSQIVNMLDISDLSDVVVVGSEGEEIYVRSGISEQMKERGRNAIMSALDGSNTVLSGFSDGAFKSCASVPIVEKSAIIGAVCVYEIDEVQGGMLISLRNDLLKITAAVCFLSLVLSIFYSETLAFRITQVLDAIRTVREGEYTYRITIRGHDEVAQLSEEFNSLTGRLQSTEDIRRQFVADASHELKTPLASIRLLSDSIVQNSNMNKETMLEFVNDISSEAERLARTTEELLALTRLDNSKKAEMALPRIDFGHVASRAMRVLLPIASEKGVTLSFSFAENCTLLAIEDDIYRVVLNLVENAIKYNRENGSVKVTLDSHEKLIFLTVEDTGIGIPESDLPHIFERFYRVDKARSREMGGSGLGLSIVYSIVKQFSGEIKAENRENGGMKFTVIFPLDNPNEE